MPGRYITNMLYHWIGMDSRYLMLRVAFHLAPSRFCSVITSVTDEKRLHPEETNVGERPRSGQNRSSDGGVVTQNTGSFVSLLTLSLCFIGMFTPLSPRPCLNPKSRFIQCN